MNAHWSRWLALGFGSGLLPVAPGTAGTALAWALWAVMSLWLDNAALLIVVMWSLVLGPWICEQTVRALGVHDHPAIVWDEVAAFWALLWLTGGDVWWQLLAFVLFRFFDSVKPWPISWVDRRVKGGFGVMIDDVIAAGAALLVIGVVKLVW
ncbi:MAG: phosphatidylglycerophosphatase A [Burkholderiaceae bacterium]